MIAILGVVILVALVSRLASSSGGLSWGMGSAPSPIYGGGSVKLSAAQIAQYAKRAGFTGTALSTAIAVALAESSGNTVAYNPETAANTPEGMGSYGLWQIYLHAHPEFSDSDLFDPQENANAAYRVYQMAGYNFNPWSTFKNNAYQSHLDVASRYA